MSLQKRLESRFKTQLLAQAIAAVSGGLLVVLLARLLTTDAYGSLFLALSVLGILELLSKLGIAKSGARFIAEYKGTTPEQVPNIIKTTISLNLVALLLAVSLLLVSHRYLAELLGEPRLVPLLLLGTLYLAFDSFATYFTTIFQAFERIKFAAKIYALDRTARLVFAVVFVVLGFGTLGALSGYIVAFAISCLVGAVGLYVQLSNDGFEPVPIEEGLRKRITEYTFPLTATNTANVLDKRIDTVLVGFFLNPVAVSYYVVSKQIIYFIEVPAAALGVTLSPTFGAEKAKGNVDRLSRIYEEAVVNSLLLYVPAAIGVILVSRPTIELLFGTEYQGAVPVLQVLGLYVVFYSITETTGHGLDYLGRARSRAIAQGMTSVLNVLLNVVLIPLIGVVGAAIATNVTYSLYTAFNLYLIGSELNLRADYVFRKLSAVVGITVVMGAIVYLAADYIVDVPTLFLVIALGGGVWLLLSEISGMTNVRSKVLS